MDLAKSDRDSEANFSQAATEHRATACPVQSRRGSWPAFLGARENSVHSGAGPGGSPQPGLL
jgi:hypothetical protein